jgi:hypothetical protein
VLEVRKVKSLFRKDVFNAWVVFQDRVSRPAPADVSREAIFSGIVPA